MVESIIKNHLEIVKVLAKFQAIEATLKVAIVKFEFQSDKKGNTQKDSYSLSIVDDLSFGILLRRFKQYYGTSEVFIELHSRLLKLKDTRNFFAHKAFLSESNMPKNLKNFIGVEIARPVEYDKLNAELDECVLLLCSQLKSFE